MNDVTIKLTCPCGAALEIRVPESARTWLKTQMADWQRTHCRCSQGHARLQRLQRLQLPDPAREVARPTVQTFALCRCGHDWAAHGAHPATACQVSNCYCARWETSVGFTPADPVPKPALKP